MVDERQLQDDLSYVRSAVARGETGSNPAGVYFLWAAITFVGFALLDYVPEKSGLFWMFAGPLGGVASGLLGRRAGRARGQGSEAAGRRHWLHWTALVLAIVLLLPLTATGRIPPGETPRLVLLLVAFAYFTGGAYLDARLRWIAGAVAGCYLLTVVQPQMPRLWTVTAFILAASFVAGGLVTAASERRQQQTPEP
jgi:hypothetical protein